MCSQENRSRYLIYTPKCVCVCVYRSFVSYLLSIADPRRWNALSWHTFEMFRFALASQRRSFRIWEDDNCLRRSFWCSRHYSRKDTINRLRAPTDISTGRNIAVFTLPHWSHEAPRPRFLAGIRVSAEVVRAQFLSNFLVNNLQQRIPCDLILGRRIFRRIVYKEASSHSRAVDARSSGRPKGDIRFPIVLHWLYRCIDFPSRKRSLEKRILLNPQIVFPRLEYLSRYCVGNYVIPCQREASVSIELNNVR